MSRIYKFRAWNKEENLMYDWNGVKYEIYAHLRNVWEDGSFELMQFTGLRDKNGKEIWEGDVVKFNDSNDMYVMEWCSIRLGGGFCPVDKKCKHAMISRDIEAIGNVYENPEFIKEAP